MPDRGDTVLTEWSPPPPPNSSRALAFVPNRIFIDPGLRNMAWLLYEGESNSVVEWAVKSIIPQDKSLKSLKTQDIYDCVLRWIESDEMMGMWVFAHEIYVELQMVGKFKHIVTMLFTRFPHKVKLLAPAKFRSATSGNWGSHGENKKKDIQYVEARTAWPTNLLPYQKKDDLATVWLMMEYVCKKSEVVEGEKITSKRKRDTPEGQEEYNTKRREKRKKIKEEINSMLNL